MIDKNETLFEGEAFAGHYLDYDTLSKCASGGAATAIAEGFIATGGIVISVGYSSDYRNAVFYRVDTVDGLDTLRGSIYFTTEKKVIFDNNEVSLYKMISLLLLENRKVLVIALGCDIAAIYRYCSDNSITTERLYSIDLICHGPTYREVHVSYIELLERRYNSKVEKFSVKYKKKAWYPSYIFAQFENGKQFEEIWNDSIYCYAFNHFSRKACSACKFKGMNHMADLTVGDYWGIDSSSSIYNKYGVSAIIRNSAKGIQLLDMIDLSKYVLEQTDKCKIIQGNPMYEQSRVYNGVKTKEFLDNIKKNGLYVAVRKDMGLFRWIQFYIKKYTKKIIRKY